VAGEDARGAAKALGVPEPGAEETAATQDGEGARSANLNRARRRGRVKEKCMTRLSNRQYPMLQALYDQGINGRMTIEEAQAYDQRPFRSMLIRKWCAYKPGKGFHITREGTSQ
jgi:hypothetical protein